LLYALGFIFVFVIGGISGVMTGAVPLDWQVHNTYFVIAHIHYVVAGTVVFALLAGTYYWFPKMFGRMMSEMLGPLGFWLVFLGFNLAFFPMHIVGLMGMSRQIYTYPAGLGWTGPNMAETIGAFIMALGVLVVIIDFFSSLYRGERAPDNPWHADSLEWAVSSPPPPYNFLRIPLVHSREPLWDEPELARINDPGPEGGQAVAAPARMLRETAATSVLDAESVETIVMPDDSGLPLLLAFGLLVFFIGFLPDITFVQVFVVTVGVVICLVALFAWFWPTEEWQEAV
jgi:cytochrome c oxidase subunit 1/cytochrome c oxidase subunit I+III